MVNTVILSGILEKGFEYSHSHGKKRFYKAVLAVKRLSKNIDIVPLIIPEWKLPDNWKYISKDIALEVSGELHTRNILGDDNKIHLDIYVYVKHIKTVDVVNSNNLVTIVGFVSKIPVYRETPAGKKITEFMLAVNDEKRKTSYYIPCIAWDFNARLINSFEMGDKVLLTGRFQSRTYSKQLGKKIENRTAFEISTIKINKCFE